MFDVDDLRLLPRELLRERLPVLVEQVCAWSVGLSDRPHLHRSGGRLVASGSTLGTRAALDRPLASAADERLELADARAGSFLDVLGALAADGRLYADLLDEQVLAPFVRDTCVRAAGRARRDQPAAWQELLDELGDDGSDLGEVVHDAEWEAPLRVEAEQAVLAALAAVPLVEVEAEGLPLSLVQAAESETRAAAPVRADEPVLRDEDLSGALFLAEAALASAGLPVPVPADRARELLAALLAEGLEAHEVLAVLPHLPVRQDAVEQIGAAVDDVLRDGR